MKTTIDIADALLAELNVIAACEDRALPEVLDEVVTLGLIVRRATSARRAATRDEAEAWLRNWLELGRRIERNAVDPRPCVEILRDDRR